jgi:1-acyl-sn-glycerol-3-phosphate acyltransferase
LASESDPKSDRRLSALDSISSSRTRSGAVSRGLARRHSLQRLISMAAGPLWVSLVIIAMRFHFRYRIANLSQIREHYRKIRAQSDAPLLICGNHLTLIDSILMAWSLGSGFYWLSHPDELPWNTPESKNFGRTRLSRTLIFIAKCIPITRGGAREGVGDVLERIKYLLSRGETALLFPEAGRSRSGRVEEGSGAWGVGRVVGSVPGCRVLCIYLRGRSQESWSDYPAKGDTMDVSLACIEPKSDLRGARRSRELAQQVVRQLARMEEDYFDARQ